MDDKSAFWLDVLKKAREGYATHGRGFIFVMGHTEHDGVDRRYCGISSTEYRDFSDTPRLEQLVQSYAPDKEFVMLVSVFDDTTRHLKIDSVTLTKMPPTALSA